MEARNEVEDDCSVRGYDFCHDPTWLAGTSNWSESDFDFFLTEGQSRRGLLTDCNSDCSQIFDYLFVGGSEVAKSRKALEDNHITRIVNCSASIIDNFFDGEPGMKYLSLNMVDGRQDDISWFLGEVFHFILSGKAAGENILLHCERGVSRSCSFAIAYHMWTSGCSWMDSFNFVKSKRICCAPNTAFTCNLIEINECLRSDFKFQNVILYRLASHLLPDDPNTVVLKMCRDKLTRKSVTPKTSILNPKGVYVIKPPDRTIRSEMKNKNGVIRCNSQSYEKGISELRELDTAYPLYLWKGGDASEESYSMALKLAHKILGVYTSATHIVSVSMGNEPKEFMDNVLQDGTFRNEENNSEYFEDLFTDFAPVEDLEDTEFYTESESSSPYKSLESVGLKSSLSSHLNAFSSDDSRDQKYRRSMSLSAGSRSRSNSEGSIDMFYDYSNSSDDESEYSVCLNKAEGEATDDTEGQTLFADADSDTPVCIVDYGFDDCIGRTKVRSLSNLGTSGTDRDTPLCNTPYELIENGFRCRPPLPPLLNTSSSGMLKRISNAAAKYGQALNLNLNLNLNLSRLNCQTGESRSLNLSPNSSTAYRGWSDDKYESSGHTSRSGRSDAPDFSGRTSTEISRQSSLLDIDGDGAEIHDCDASNVKLSKWMPSSTKPSDVAPAKCATQTALRP